MTTLFTRHFLIVVSAAVAAAANAAANENDLDPTGGLSTFTVPLSVSGNAPAQAYWVEWTMTQAQAVAIRARLIQHGATTAEATPIAFPNGTPSSNRFGVFDVDAGWTPDLVLSVVGVQPINPPPP